MDDRQEFWIAMSGIISGFVLAVIAAVAKCIHKSRCSKVQACCMSCDRDVLQDESLYKDNAQV